MNTTKGDPLLEFDTSHMPMGSLGWKAFLEAVEAAAPEDESQWLEFKGGTDPGKPSGSAALAKAIVAFANRKPSVASNWLGGHALIVVGIEPGNLQGAVRYDPAVIHDKIGKLLAPPAPAWDVTYHDYKGKQVLVLTVGPPKPGAPIYCIGKSSDAVVDGHIYVRRLGKSEPAKADDIRWLSARMQAATAKVQIEVEAVIDGGQRRCDWTERWLDTWIAAERRRLVDPLEPPSDPIGRPSTGDPRFGEAALPGLNATLGDYMRLEAKVARARRPFEDLAAQIAAAGTEPEDRTPDEFRETVETYLVRCRQALKDAPMLASARALRPVTWIVKNLTEDNLEDVELKVHVEGDVFGYDDSDYFRLSDLCPTPPRTWGPRTVVPAQEVFRQIATPTYAPTLNPRPRPTVENGGSVDMRFPPVHLRPRATRVVGDQHVLVVKPGFAGPMRCTWSATATNLSGIADGALAIPVDDNAIDIGGLLEHRAHRRGRTLRPGQTGDGWEPPS